MDDKAEISVLARRCKHVFEACVANPAVAQQPWVRSAQGDFNLWCAATKAISTSKSSLGYCLRNKQDARATICGLIRALADSIETCFNAIVAQREAEAKASDAGPAKKLSDEERPESPLSWAVTSGASDSVPEDLVVEDPVVAEHLSYVKSILGQLSRLAMAIRKSGNKDRFKKADASLDDRAFVELRKHLTVVILRAFEDPEARHLPASVKMTRASDCTRLDKVQQRLVHANILRRNRIEVMAQSHKLPTRQMRSTQQPGSLVKSLDMADTPSQIAASRAVPQQPKPSLTVARPAPQESSVAGPSRTITAAATITEAGSDLDDRFKQILARKPVSAVTAITRIGASQAYPRCPSRDMDGSLRCPYCGDLLPAEYAEPRYRESWKAHVAEDLIPYSCIADDCVVPDEMYLTAEKLLAHTLEEHSVPCWTCDYCSYGASKTSIPTPKQFFPTAEAWISHVAEMHQDLIAPQERSIFADMNKRQMIGPLSCPLCDFASDSLTAGIDDHILGHLHEFALRALPNTVVDLPDNNTGTTARAYTPLSHTQSANNATAELQYPTISTRHLFETVHDLEIGTVALLPDSDEAATEVWQARASRLHAMIMIRDEIDAEQWATLLRDAIDDLNSASRYAAPPYCPGSGTWEPFEGPKTANIPTRTAQFKGREHVMDQLDEILISGPESDQQVRVMLTGLSSMEKRSIACELAHKLQKGDSFSIFWVNATTEDSINRSLAEMADLFPAVIATAGNAFMRRRHLIHYLTWSFSGSWLMVLDGMNFSTSRYLAFEGLLPQALSGHLLFITSDPGCVTLHGLIKAVEALGTYFLVPYVYNPDFIGRSDILEKLKDQFGHGQHLSREWPQTVVLLGPGGIGKTQIALAYVYWLQEVCPDVSVFWVCADDAEGFRQSYASIAQVFEIPGYEDPEADIMLLAKRWLESKDRGQWLMVIDNLGDLPVFFDQYYIPQCAHGSILITTRNKGVSLSLPKGALSIAVTEMHENESEELLHVMLEGADVTSSELAVLSSRLLHIPLALVQAAAFIREKAVTSNEYLRLLNKEEHHLVDLFSGEPETLSRDSWYRAPLETWALSFEQIQRQDAFASELLSVMSFLDRQAIPLEFLADYGKQQQEPKGTVLLTKAIGVLKAFSFVTEEKENGLNMHQLVQRATRDWLAKKGTARHFAGQALLAVSHCYPYGSHENRAVCGAYLAHAHMVLSNDGIGSTDERIAQAALLHSVAGFFNYRGQWEAAEAFQEKVVTLRGDLLGSEHPDTLTSMVNLALTYLNRGRWAEAEKLGVLVMETSSRVLGLEHPDTLLSMANLASTYRNQGRWEEAEKLDVQVMETRKTKLGADHLDILTSMNNLALTYWNQGRWLEAEKLDLQVMETRKTKLGADHPSTLISMANLASTYRNQGRWSEAEKLGVLVMETSSRVLGLEHPDTLSSMANLTSTYRNQGRWSEAEKLDVLVMETRKTKLGADHPDTLTSMANLASTYRNQGRWSEAEKLDLQVMETCKTKLGADHPSTLMSMANLASTYRNQGRWLEAEKLFVQVMETSKTKLGADHPSTLMSMANLASTWKIQGQHQEALILIEECARVQQRVLGTKHPDTLSSWAAVEQWRSEGVSSSQSG
ncbi:hypothetical protein OQA88_1853 [Cercophora sp. LCS_1]